MTPAVYAIAGLSIALAISLTGNALLGREYLETRDALTKAEGEREAQRSAADVCTTSVSSIAKAAAAQVATAAAAAASARSAAAQRQSAADEILSTPASVPGDDCKSAQERVERWLTRRAQK